MKDSLHRRDFVKISAAGAAAAALGSAAGPSGTSKTELEIAGYSYDRVRAIQDGRVGIEGVDVRFSTQDIYAVSRSAFGPAKTYPVTELGLIPFVRKYINEDYRAYTAIPVFVSRTFRHRNVFVRADSGIEKPEQLRGKRVGTPGYGFSAHTWIRGFLQDQYGVEPGAMSWIETTASSDGGKVSPKLDRHYLPDDFPLKKGPSGVDESELLLEGGCDALVTAITPRGFLEGDPRIRRLFPDFRAAEQAYFRDTKVFPIMHIVAIRSDVVEAQPDLPKKVFEMYSRAKQAAYDDLGTTTALKITLPWVTREFEQTQQLMGENFWSYGVEANRKELELVMRYLHEQGLVKKRMDFHPLFHPSTLELVDAL